MNATYRTVRDKANLRVIFNAFPAGLERFGPRCHTFDGTRIHIICRGDATGYDLSPILVAADWIREQGWAIKCTNSTGTLGGRLPHDICETAAS